MVSSALSQGIRGQGDRDLPFSEPGFDVAQAAMEPRSVDEDEDVVWPSFRHDIVPAGTDQQSIPGSSDCLILNLGTGGGNMPISISYRFTERFGVSLSLRDAIALIFWWL
jgi:hypothetical protein